MTTPAANNLSDVPPATPGYVTTEFWKTLIYSGLSLATGLGVIGPNVPAKYQAIIDSVAFIAGAVCVGLYALSRGSTKAAAIQATADVITSREIRAAKTLSAPGVTTVASQPPKSAQP